MPKGTTISRQTTHTSMPKFSLLTQTHIIFCIQDSIPQHWISVNSMSISYTLRTLLGHVEIRGKYYWYRFRRLKMPVEELWKEGVQRLWCPKNAGSCSVDGCQWASWEQDSPNADSVLSHWPGQGKLSMFQDEMCFTLVKLRLCVWV